MTMRGRGSALRRAVLSQHNSSGIDGAGSTLFGGMDSGHRGERRNIIIRGGPSSPKFVVHEGRKKRLAWGGGAARGGKEERRRRRRQAPPVMSSDSNSSGEESDGANVGGVRK